VTEAEAKKLAASGWWCGKSAREIADFQLREPMLCMSFSDFHKAVTDALGRPVYNVALRAAPAPAGPTEPGPTEFDEPPWPGWFSCEDCQGWFNAQPVAYDSGANVCGSCAEKRGTTGGRNHARRCQTGGLRPPETRSR
jgi:hypothetical protein